MSPSEIVRCKCRKQAITGLRCSRCFVPICPDCSRPAPVGMLCRDCARGKPSHLHQIDPKRFAIAIPVTLAAALFGGWLIATIGHIGFFGMCAGFLYGMVVGEIALRLTGRKRGPPMEIMAGACVFLGLIGGYVLQLSVAMARYTSHAHGVDLETTAGPLALVAATLVNRWIYVTIAVAVFGAVSRIRNIG